VDLQKEEANANLYHDPAPLRARRHREY